MKIKKYRKIIKRISVISFYLFLFITIGSSVLYKINHRTLYLFGNRFDVVLSASMATKNEKHKDFLEGHDQIQPFDFVISKQVDKTTELHVYDVVLFKNPGVGTDMHRIVDIKYEGDYFTFDKIEKSTYNTNNTFCLSKVSSSIVSQKSVLFSGFEIVTYSDKPYDKNEFHINIDYSPVDFAIESELVNEEYYKNTLSFDRGTSAPAIFSITKKSYFFDSYFSYIKLLSSKGDIKIESTLLDGAEEQEYVFHPVPKYQIRGDAIENEDGWFYQDSIYSKVNIVIPKFGYFARFISSPFGVILIIVLCISPVVYSYIVKRKESKSESK